MASKALIPFLVAMMLVTGVCNTLLTKYQDLQCVRNCHARDPTRREHFEQPVIQTAQMFIGEMGCWLVVASFAVYRRLRFRKGGLWSGEYQPVGAVADTVGELDDDLHRTLSQEAANPAIKPLVPNDDTRRQLKGWSITLLALPACCDIAGTTLMNVGLLFVAASIYQMTRGALVLFVGLFSVIFLRRHLRLYQWLSLVIVVLGVAIVGLAGAIQRDPQALPTVTQLKQGATHGLETVKATAQTPAALQTTIGVLMIAGAQIFTATQFVLEEWILERYSLEPLKVVGWEGVFGFLVTLFGMIVMHLAVGRTEKGRYGYFDAREGWREISHNRAVAVSSVLIMISIGGFNFFGLSVTRTVSATSRSTIDTCRTLFIWIVSLGLGWETFKWLQVAGFALLVYGTFLFNDIVSPPMRRCMGGRREELLPEEPIEHM
ncbi:MAG: hypothetical protein M1817_004897 [Caeruleum heppii]|nr:MAG: hypothetical protein M1817_004897 [Caeruleum heppii]